MLRALLEVGHCELPYELLPLLLRPESLCEVVPRMEENLAHVVKVRLLCLQFEAPEPVHPQLTALQGDLQVEWPLPKTRTTSQQLCPAPFS